MPESAATDNSSQAPLEITITREPGDDFCTLNFSFGGTEDIEGADVVDFICQYCRGPISPEIRALIERAVDDAWNFYSAKLVLTSWKPLARAFGAPKV